MWRSCSRTYNVICRYQAAKYDSSINAPSMQGHCVHCVKWKQPLRAELSIDATKSQFKTARVGARSRNVSSDIHYSIFSDLHSPNLGRDAPAHVLLTWTRTCPVCCVSTQLWKIAESPQWLSGKIYPRTEPLRTFRYLYHIGPEAKFKDFHKKILFYWKIITLSIFCLKMPPMAQKPAFLTYSWRAPIALPARKHRTVNWKRKILSRGYKCSCWYSSNVNFRLKYRLPFTTK